MKQRKRMNDDDDCVQDEKKIVTFTNINCIKWQEITINYVNLVCLNLVGGTEKKYDDGDVDVDGGNGAGGGDGESEQNMVLVHLEASNIAVSLSWTAPIRPWWVSVYTPRFFATTNIVNRRHGIYTLVEFIIVYDSHDKRKPTHYTDVLKMEIQYSVLMNRSEKRTQK